MINKAILMGRLTRDPELRHRHRQTGSQLYRSDRQRLQREQTDRFYQLYGVERYGRVRIKVLYQRYDDNSYRSYLYKKLGRSGRKTQLRYRGGSERGKLRRDQKEQRSEHGRRLQRAGSELRFKQQLLCARV